MRASVPMSLGMSMLTNVMRPDVSSLALVVVKR